MSLEQYLEENKRLQELVGVATINGDTIIGIARTDVEIVVTVLLGCMPYTIHNYTDVDSVLGMIDVN
jgi:hypothetical protein